MAITTLIKTFPLHTYAEEQLPAKGPNEKQLWVYQSGSAKKSFDLDCLRWQAALRFADIQGVTYVPWTFDDGAVNGRLPSLHLSDGTLLSSEELPNWLDTNIKVLESEEPTVRQVNDSSIWSSLITNSVIPLLLVLLNTEPLYSIYTKPLYYPNCNKGPPLSRMMHSLLSSNKRAQHLRELRTHMNLPQSASVDLEDVEAKAYEALAALETKIASKEEGSIWFLGSKHALPVDSLLFATVDILCRIGNALPEQDSAKLSQKLKQCPKLVTWSQRTENRFFAH